ncbi:MAG: aldehyde dehydrogenase [Alphaproteobacteria bacterium]|nr:aldehyde dehydrogenase [Alphaproteobacteria bacterium]
MAGVLEKFPMLIDGKAAEPSTGAWFESFNPYTGQPWALVARGARADADRAVEAAHKAFTTGEWPKLNATQRGALLFKLADLIAAHAAELGAMEVRDNGKLLAEMGAQMRYVPQWYRYFGGLADKVEGAVIPIDKPSTLTYTRPEPLGVCVAIAPWNSPLLLTSWKLAPALAAGNTMVVKPSEFTSTSISLFMKLVEQAGFPPGVINVVTGFGAEVGMALVEHPRVAKVAFTGSEATGSKVAEAAGRRLIPATLELGGKSPNIVFADANLDVAAKGVVAGIFAATGQTCIAGSRLLVEEKIHNAFVDKVLALARTARMGDPMDLGTHVGPVATQPQLEKVLKYLEIAKGEGAKPMIGGGRASRPECGTGWFVEPTIFTGVHNKMRIAQEEVFGPVLSVIPFKDDDQAVEIANDVLYGLASGIWTSNLGRAHRIAARLQAGSVWINTYRSVAPMAPFGGYKRSGLGRENGMETIRNYLQTKCVWVDMSDDFPSPFTMRI